MSIFKKMLATVGIGAAQVDMLIDDSSIAAGDLLEGVVRIQGGRVDQQVDDVYAYVMTTYTKEQNDTKVEQEAAIAKFLLAGKFTVEAEQTYEFPFSFKLPETTPVTMGRTPVWIQTGLDIKEAFDPKDQDRVKVSPHPHAQIVMDAVEQMGFRLREVSCQYAPRHGRGLPFVQEFEFVPTSEFRGRLDELEIIFYPEEDGIELLLQIDRRARGLAGFIAEAMDTDESFVQCRFNKSELARGRHSIAGELSDLIRRYV
ncbi:sporulation protein [Paenibacillus sedimenti]|uniref:Sporulation protein n=1 Tax=Paenibacillus sedimenti TaxID=2770274 RepID=A0A926KUU9_9BACL|nr:sporulation protein [Paenibacillus sedimenti]MBD0383581.1 sporulation protein [Paenibacillus sedimenti]